MRRCEVRVRRHTAATAPVVYRLLRDGASWPTWSPIDSFELERTGAGEPEGVGAVRIFRQGRVVGRDEIAELVADRRFAYRHLSGLPVRDYRAVIELEPAEPGTWIDWRVSFRPAVRGSGWLWTLILRRFIGRCAGGLAEYAPTAAP